MKNYEKPKFNIVLTPNQDVITDSGEVVVQDVNWNMGSWFKP